MSTGVREESYEQLSRIVLPGVLSSERPFDLSSIDNDLPPFIRMLAAIAELWPTELDKLIDCDAVVKDLASTALLPLDS